VPIKLTWKSVVGFLSMLGGSLTAANLSGFHLPAPVSATLVGIGGAIVLVERLADSKDYATDGGAAVSDQLASLSAAYDGVRKQLTTVQKQAVADIDAAKADYAKLVAALNSPPAASNAPAQPAANPSTDTAGRPVPAPPAAQGAAQ
jgi:hypothetical protein